jgi:hypothetical protein
MIESVRDRIVAAAAVLAEVSLEGRDPAAAARAASEGATTGAPNPRPPQTRKRRDGTGVDPYRDILSVSGHGSLTFRRAKHHTDGLASGILLF